MDNFDLKKYLAEGKLLKEDQASNLINEVQYTISGNDQQKKELIDILTKNGIKSFKDNGRLGISMSLDKNKVNLLEKDLILFLDKAVKSKDWNIVFKLSGILATFTTAEGKLHENHAE